MVASVRLLRKVPALKDAADADHLQWVRVGTMCALLATWVQCIKGDCAEYDFFWWLYALAFTYHHVRSRAARGVPAATGSGASQPRAAPQPAMERT
jgi:hypothetical protein